MSKKKGADTIELENEHLGKRDFKIAHAEALVKLEHSQKNINWTPVAGSKYTLLDGALIPTTDKGTSNEAEK